MEKIEELPDAEIFFENQPIFGADCTAIVRPQQLANSLYGVAIKVKLQQHARSFGSELATLGRNHFLQDVCLSHG
jgi:hypothetical protein